MLNLSVEPVTNAPLNNQFPKYYI